MVPNFNKEPRHVNIALDVITFALSQDRGKNNCLPRTSIEYYHRQKSGRSPGKNSSSIKIW